MSDSGRINECCGSSFGHTRQCSAPDENAVADLPEQRRARQL